LALSSGKQHIEVEGRITNRAIEGARVAIEHFDLSQLPAVLSPGHVLPHTDLDAELDGRGTFEEPEVHARFHGEGDGRGQHDLIHMSGTAEGELLRGRLNAKVFATIGGQKASAKLDVPMPPRPDQPIAVSFDASVLLSPFFADLLVPKIIQSQPILLYSLGAKVTAQGDLHGTTSDPRIHASARVARWGAANSHGNLAVSVEYAAKKLQLASTLDFSELPLGGGKGAGVVQATGVVPVDLALPLSGERGRVFDRRARLHAAVGIHDLDVSRLPWEALAVVPLVRHGRVDGTLDVAGSWASPEAKLNIAARELDVAGMNGVTLDGAAELEGSAGTADVRVAVRGADALHAHATLGERGVAADLRHAPLTASFEIPGFDLGRTDVMKELDGVLRASVRLRGSWAKPTGEAHVELAQLRSGETRLRDCVFDGRASDGALRGVLSLDEEQGGALQAKAEEDRSGKLSGELEARRFVIDARSELLPWLRELRAVVDGRLTLGGTRADPRLLGELDVSDGHLRLARSAIDYRALAAKARFADDGIEVSDLRAATGSGGQLGGHLRLGVAQAKLARLHGALSLRRFPFAWETLSGRLDASVELDGAPAKTGFATIARLDGARVTLVDDHGLPHLLPLQRLDDLSTGVARPQPVVDPVTAPKVRARAPSLAIVGPFSVSGAEIDARGAADLRVDLDTPIPNATGTLRLESGTVELYGARYTLERGLLRFAGDPDPTLELRVMRDAPRGRIGVELGGSTRQPTTRFVSESAVYDPGQVASLVTGQRLEKGGVRKKGIGEKVGGPISSLIATSFRQTDPGRSVVDVSRPVSSKKVETYESILPASTK
jgi:autotransporter translocation and assembly factor TamB